MCLGMPVIDGLELIRKVKELYPDTICAILSADQDFEYTRKAVKLRVQDYLLKPATSENIGPTLEEIKITLLKNQKIMESEILRSWMLPSATSSILNTALENEYFYFTKYRFERKHNLLLCDQNFG